MKRLAAATLIAVMLSVCMSAFALTSSEKEEKYTRAVLELETYLEEMATGENNAARLNGLAGEFDELDKYESSKELYYYTSILMQIECEDYTDWRTDIQLDQLCKNEKLNRFLEENSGTPIAGAEMLKNYYLGRKAEHEGNASDAISYYDQCISCFDAMERQFALMGEAYDAMYRQGESLMEQKKYEEAYLIFIQCSAYEEAEMYTNYILDQLGYDPAKCQGNHSNTPTVIQAATCVSEGISSVTCTVCGKTETITTQKDSKNHAGGTEIKDAKEATCGQNGYSGDTYCKDCGKKISSGTTVKATGKHKWQDATYDAPKTCTVCGKTEGTPLAKSTGNSRKVGSYVTFGHYEQDNNRSNGKEPIEWLVLDVQGDKALLISKYALDCQLYNTDYTDVT